MRIDDSTTSRIHEGGDHYTTASLYPLGMLNFVTISAMTSNEHLNGTWSFRCTSVTTCMRCPETSNHSIVHLKISRASTSLHALPMAFNEHMSGESGL